VFLLFFFVPLVPARAYADVNVTIKIKDSAPNLNPAQLNPGGTVTWRNDDNVNHEVEFEQGAVAVPAHGSSQPLVISHAFEYKIDNGTFVYSVAVAGPPVGPPATPPPATTTTTAPPPPTTTTTTLAPATTDTTATTSTTTSTTTTTTTEPESASALIPIGDAASGDSSSALPWLTGSSIFVAALAGLVYYLWWRSDKEPELTELTDLDEPMPDV
jgi:uncharacterized membrane protein